MGGSVITAKLKTQPSAIKRVLDKFKVKAAEYKIEASGSIGIHETEGAAKKLTYDLKDSKLTVVDVMAIHEFNDVKPRPWLSNWFDGNKARLQSEAYAPFRNKELSAKEKTEAFKTVMIKLRDELKGALQAGALSLDELEEITVMEKTRADLPQPSTPLIATKQALQSIRSKVDGEYVD